MYLAVDTFYRENDAKTVGVLFAEWNQRAPSQMITAYRRDVPAYESGAFYKRELPCILDLLKQIDLAIIKCIVVDGYVFLDDSGKGGLGYYLFEALDRKTPVIGVAKTPFRDNKINVVEVVRGKSARPLYITAIGIDASLAAAIVKEMHGAFRFPALLKELDDLTKAD